MYLTREKIAELQKDIQTIDVVGKKDTFYAKQNADQRLEKTLKLDAKYLNILKKDKFVRSIDLSSDAKEWAIRMSENGCFVNNYKNVL